MVKELDPLFQNWVGKVNNLNHCSYSIAKKKLWKDSCIFTLPPPYFVINWNSVQYEKQEAQISCHGPFTNIFSLVSRRRVFIPSRTQEEVEKREEGNSLLDAFATYIKNLLA